LRPSLSRYPSRCGPCRKCHIIGTASTVQSSLATLLYATFYFWSEARPSCEPKSTSELEMQLLRPNLAVDSDAQLRPRAARAPVGRRSPLRCTGTAAPLSPEGVLRSPGLRPLEARRSGGWFRPRLVDTPRTAAEFICVGPQRPSPASWPKEAGHSFGAAANAVGSRLSSTSMPVCRPSMEAVAGAVGQGRCGLRACERRVQEMQPRARYNRSVDSDAQLRMLPAVAPVGRRSPSR